MKESSETRAGVKELKNNLSRYLQLVKQGTEVMVTDRGIVVARLVSVTAKAPSAMEKLAPLIVDGTLIPAAGRLSDFEPIEVGGTPASKIVTDDRR